MCATVPRLPCQGRCQKSQIFDGGVVGADIIRPLRIFVFYGFNGHISTVRTHGKKISSFIKPI